MVSKGVGSNKFFIFEEKISTDVLNFLNKHKIETYRLNTHQMIPDLMIQINMRKGYTL